MAAGFLYGETCFATVADATAAYFAAWPVSVLQTSTTTSVFMPIVNGGPSWGLQKTTYSATGAKTINFNVAAPTLAFPSCTVVNDPVENFTDGTILGWGIVLAMAIAWGFRESRRHTK